MGNPMLTKRNGKILIIMNLIQIQKAIVQGSRVLVDDLEMFVKEQSTTVEKTTLLLFKTMEERTKSSGCIE